MPGNFHTVASVHVKRGDTVRIGQGKDRGKQGRVLRVFPKKGEILVEGINIIKKAIKPSQDNTKGGFDEREAPIHVGKALLVCPSCGKTTRLAYRVIADKKVRYCKKCDAIIEDNLER
jgi:large subunit ribosomal protein L24